MAEREHGEDPLAGAVRATLRAEARLFAERVDLLVELHEETRPELREFLDGEVAVMMHLSPVTAGQRWGQALLVADLPVLRRALHAGVLAVPQALALVGELEQLDLTLRRAVLDVVLSPDALEEHADEHDLDSRTPGELRAAARRVALRLDAEAAARRREAARARAGARVSRDTDGLAALVVTGTAGEVVQAHAALRARAAALVLDADADLTQGQREVLALLQALGVPGGVQVQAAVECPVVRPGVVDLRLSAATALGLSDEPGELTGYGPVDADAARMLLPAADLVKVCVDAVTGEVLSVDAPRRARRGERTAPQLRRALVDMATTPSVQQETETEGYVPSAALGRLVDLRDVTSVFPGDATPARRAERDHRVPHPQGPTSAENLQNLRKRWHRAKHLAGWRCWSSSAGTVWISPRGNPALRRHRRNPPPPLTRSTLPPLS